MTYNGWTNYETWNVKLWLDNDEGLYSMVRDLAEKSFDDTTELATALNGFVDELLEQTEMPTSGLFCDLLTHALGQVDWHEIAAHLLEEIEEENAA